MVIAALVVSIVSAPLALTGLIWQMMLYRLSGARLRVQLMFEFADEAGKTTAVTNTRRAPWSHRGIAEMGPNSSESSACACE